MNDILEIHFTTYLLESSNVYKIWEFYIYSLIKIEKIWTGRWALKICASITAQLEIWIRDIW